MMAQSSGRNQRTDGEHFSVYCVVAILVEEEGFLQFVRGAAGGRAGLGPGPGLPNAAKTTITHNQHNRAFGDIDTSFIQHFEAPPYCQRIENLMQILPLVTSHDWGCLRKIPEKETPERAHISN